MSVRDAQLEVDGSAVDALEVGDAELLDALVAGGDERTEVDPERATTATTPTRSTVETSSTVGVAPQAC